MEEVRLGRSPWRVGVGLEATGEGGARGLSDCEPAPHVQRVEPRRTLRLADQIQDEAEAQRRGRADGGEEQVAGRGQVGEHRAEPLEHEVGHVLEARPRASRGAGAADEQVSLPKLNLDRHGVSVLPVEAEVAGLHAELLELCADGAEVIAVDNVAPAAEGLHLLDALEEGDARVLDVAVHDELGRAHVGVVDVERLRVVPGVVLLQLRPSAA
mmetsp:Transcript_30442/g.97361  ORF Transcript_30442/g.97361 Transcript_30442/m.97361 type:complete len:213 (+) Transcript_30442:504-1142(+)